VKTAVGRETKLLTFALAALLLLPRLAWAHHFMGEQLPQTFTQGFLSGLGHPVIGVDHAAFIIAAGFLLAPIGRGMRGVLALILGSRYPGWRAASRSRDCCTGMPTRNPSSAPSRRR
jgi:hydrogenase/urease accessory protein HupE